MASHLSITQFLGRTILIIVAVAVSLFLWQVMDVLLLAFVGLLLAIFLRTLMRLLQRVIRLPDRVIFWVVALGLLLIGGLVVWFLAPRLSQELSQLLSRIPDALRQLGAQLTQYGWTQDVIDRFSLFNQGTLNRILPSSGTLFTRITGTFSVALNVLANLVFIFFAGLFLAADPALYQAGLVSLAPPSRRKRLRTVIDEVVITLRWWLVGQSISMVVIGTLTGIVLWLTGVPFALGLGLIAGFLEFVPYIGPIVSGFLATLLAFVQSPTQAFYVLLIYIGIQLFESNVLTPLVHRYTVSLPPALSLSAVLILGVLFGFIGILVATPLLAVLLVLVKMLYLEDVLSEVQELPQRLLKERPSAMRRK